jgi:hypothetical protein
MPSKREVVKRYRKAAATLFDASKVEQEVYIRHPDDDTGGWAPEALAVIYLEPDGRRTGDAFKIPTALDIYGEGWENAIRLAETAGVGYIEHINAAVAAVYEI